MFRDLGDTDSKFILNDIWVIERRTKELFVTIETFYQNFCGDNFVKILENMILGKSYDNVQRCIHHF